MTTEEKTKAYNKVREKIALRFGSNVAEEIFSEFEESEDERIRNCIGMCLIDANEQRFKDYNTSLKECIAWLEKQESNLVENGYTNNKDFIRYADNYSHEIWHKLMDNFKNIKDYHIGCNDVSDIVLNAIIDTCNWLEKQGDSNNQSWKPSKEQINALEHFVRSIAESGYASPYDDNTKLLKSLINDLHKLEKQKDTNALIQEASEKAYTEGMRVERKHWLEKQGESTLIEEIKRRKELYSREKEKAVLFAEKLSLGGRIAVLEELLVFVKEKQGEQKPFDYQNVNIPQRDFEPKSAMEAIKEEKVDNQNCVNNADKDEAKFQVGDWIISIVNHNVYRILNIKDNKYQLDYLEGTYWYDKKYVDSVCRLWDIKDARDGDILADEYSIILFRKIGNVEFTNVIDFHVGLNLYKNRIVKRNGIRHYGNIEDTEFKPATKEQRKMFLQRIHEEGYGI